MLAAGLAGCSSKEKAPACAEPTCDASPTGSSTGSPSTTPTGPPPIDNAIFPEIRWEDCTGLFGRIEVDRGQAQAVVPAAFNLEEETPLTASLRFVAVQCDRVATTHQVLTKQAFFEFMADVDPANESWGTGISRYVLDSLVTAPELADALAAMGASPRSATLTRTRTPTTDGGSHEQWNFQASDLTVEFEYATRGTMIDLGAARELHWYASGDGFRRMEDGRAYEYDTILAEPGLLRMTGSSNASPVLAGGCCIEWAGGAFHKITEVWTGNSTIYRT